jgi:hypothetical protein
MPWRAGNPGPKGELLFNEGKGSLAVEVGFDWLWRASGEENNQNHQKGNSPDWYFFVGFGYGCHNSLCYIGYTHFSSSKG